MKILILSPYPKKIIQTIKKTEDSYEIYTKKVNLSFLKEKEIDFIISYGYQHIIENEIIQKYKNSIINLHISFLPFNRGSHPNLWSHIEGTPSGISIHQIDEGIDTGGIIFRKKILIDTENHTFKTSYELLKSELEILFERNWVKIRQRNYKVILPIENGTFHLKKEGIELLSLLSEGWDTNIKQAISESNNLKNKFYENR